MCGCGKRRFNPDSQFESILTRDCDCDKGRLPGGQQCPKCHGAGKVPVTNKKEFEDQREKPESRE